MLGFRGHFSTKTRHYSTTLAQLRQARTDYQNSLNTPAGTGPKERESTLVISHWAYAGTGLTPDLERLATLVTPPPGTGSGSAPGPGVGVIGGA